MIRIPKMPEIAKMPAGGYVCRVVKATEGVNRYDEPCLLLWLDVDEGEFKGYFEKIYEKRIGRGSGRYPCVYSQPVGKYSAGNFKRLVGKLEQSNTGYFFTGKQGEAWDESELEGLKIGVVFSEKKFFDSQDKRRVHLVPREVKTVEEIRRGNYRIPERSGFNGRHVRRLDGRTGGGGGETT